MSPHELIKSYLDKATPKNVSLKKQSNIRMELMCHICDKADFYKEIGYSEEESYEKALAEMGESEEVCQQFEDIYREKGIYSVLTFLAIHFIDIIAVILGFGGSFISILEGDKGMIYSFESLILSSCFVCGMIILIMYSYKEKKKKMLLTIAISNLFLSITPFFFNSIYFPLAEAILHIPFNNSNFSSDLLFFSADFISIPLCIISFVLFAVVKTNKDNLQETSRRKKSYKILSAVTVCLVASFIAVVAYMVENNTYEYYNYSVFGYYFSENKDKKEYTELYNRINQNMSFDEADKILRDAGYIPHTEFGTVIKDKEELEYELEYLQNNIIENPDVDVVYIKPTKFGDLYAFHTSIIIPKEDGKAIPWKKLNGEIYLRNKLLSYLTIFNDEKVYGARTDFESLRFGYSKQKVLELISKNCNIESLKTEYNNDSVKETYCISCHEDNSDLFDYDHSYFYATIVFNNDSLVSGKYTYNRYYEEYDSEKEDYVDKEINEGYIIES